MAYDPLDPQGDPFHPPEVPTEVGCLHCGKQYDSYLIEWRIETDADGKQHGFWCCPTPGCDGRGFGFDILPTDPHYRDERGGWFSDDEDEEGEEDEGEDGPFGEGEFDEDDFGENEFSESEFGGDESDEDELGEEPFGDESLKKDDPGGGPSDSGNGREPRNGKDEQLPW